MHEYEDTDLGGGGAFPNEDLFTHEDHGDPVPTSGVATGNVRGSVRRSASGEPVAGAAILVAQGPGPAPDIAPLTNDDGWFAFDDLPSGVWTLRALGPRAETGEAMVEVSAGSTAHVLIDVSD